MGPLLLRNGGILNASERRCIAHIHLLRFVFVSLNEVDDHVNHDFSFSVALHHPDVLLDSRERCDVIVCDLRNFGDQLISSLLGHFSVPDGHVILLNIAFNCRGLLNAAVIFDAILHLHHSLALRLGWRCSLALQLGWGCSC